MNTKAGIMINDLHSYDDFGLYIADRNVSPPERVTNFVSLPYMNGYYDFGAIIKPYYSSRTLTYTFDIMEDDEVTVEALKNEIISWAQSAVESKIYDDADPDYYFIGSYTSAQFASDDNLPEYGGKMTLTFTAQPYRYNRETDEGVI